jgi:hypothetical protein
MKLSDAIVLGDTLKKRDDGYWLSTDKTCGCALGGAMLAIGKGDEMIGEDWIFCGRYPFTHWPWLSWEHLRVISGKFYSVCHGEMTFEELVDYVRSIEPPEVEEQPAEQEERVHEILSV